MPHRQPLERLTFGGVANVDQSTVAFLLGGAERVLERQARARFNRGPTLDLGRDDLQGLTIDLAQERRPSVQRLDQATQGSVDDVQNGFVEIGDHQAADQGEVWLAVRAHEGAPRL